MTAKRVRTLKDGPEKPGAVLYWMSRDQRVQDNWALLHAQELALANQAPLAVCFCLVPGFLNAAFRQYSFMIHGLAEVEKNLAAQDIPFLLRTGNPNQEIPDLVKSLEATVLVTDFDPLKVKRAWKDDVAKKLAIPMYEVDAHNIVPCWQASPKQEWAAYTFRPKVRRALDEFLTDFPELADHPHKLGNTQGPIAWQDILKNHPADRTVPEVDWLKPGEIAAQERLKHFLEDKLAHYDRDRNDPTKDGQSNLSPYLHFGQISAQRVALAVIKSKAPQDTKDAFLEELIVRRELSDNFCFYNDKYDDFAGFPDWAQKSLKARRRDERDYVYSLEEFENALTHDDAWNAAQREMVLTGKMHGYMRMYWAKKILEWTASPEEAMEIAIYLNDRYELDGRDPNGYVGIAWSIGGVHDRAWKERPVFGKIRYMSFGGLKSKFAVEDYIKKFPELKQ
jgi:deoxyribodipyrimidine photo-lyase